MSTPPKEDPPLCVPGGTQFQPLLHYLRLTSQHSKSRGTDLCPVWSGTENKCIFPVPSCSTVKVWELFSLMETPPGVLALGQEWHVTPLYGNQM